MPSDWEANHLHQPNNPDTVRDMKAALDITVLKQGVYCLVFHPHGWIRSEQVVELIDHAVARHGGKVKFLTFREALDRLNQNLLAGHAIRDGQHGVDHGVRLIDVNADQCLDVVIRPFRDEHPKTRIWSPRNGQFEDSSFPSPWTYSSKAVSSEVDAAYGILDRSGRVSCLVKASPTLPVLGKPKEVYSGLWYLERSSWSLDRPITAAIQSADLPLTSRQHGSGLRLVDVDGNGVCEIVTNEAVFQCAGGRLERIGAVFPPGVTLQRRFDTNVPNAYDERGGTLDGGLRFVDVNEDGRLDLVLADAERYGVWLFKDMETGWSIKLLSGKHGERKPEDELPPIVRADGTDNGFFVHSGALYWQNEDTAHLPDLVERRSFAELLKRAAEATDRGAGP